jgi:polar amino acid transport system ATP-binding protein
VNHDSVVIDVADVRKSFNGTEVLRGIDLTVHEGEVVCILGPSGSGKSTLLRTLNHLVRPDGGMVYFEGEPLGYRIVGDVAHGLRDKELSRQRARIGMVFQHFNLFRNRTAIQNVMLGLTEVQRVRPADARKRASELLERVGLAHRLDAYPSELSGGEQQRVGIARALAMTPRVLLCDEPTSTLDPELVGEVLQVLRSLAEDGMTLVIVTHEVAFARDVADTVVFMDDGRLRLRGTPQEVLDLSEDERIVTFLKRVRNTARREAAPETAPANQLP